MHERLKYLEKVVIPSRVTKEELHGTATKRDLDQVKEELSKRATAKRPT